MYRVDRSADVPYSAAQMFKLVNDVPAYPQFLPWCAAAQVLTTEEQSVTARLTVAFGGLRKSFTTRNRFEPDECIRIGLEEGPFQHLEGIWSFVPQPDGGSRIALRLEFSFANRWVEKAFGGLFHGLTDSMVDAFCSRAAQIYPPPTLEEVTDAP